MSTTINSTAQSSEWESKIDESKIEECTPGQPPNLGCEIIGDEGKPFMFDLKKDIESGSFLRFIGLNETGPILDLSKIGSAGSRYPSIDFRRKESKGQ